MRVGVRAARPDESAARPAEWVSTYAQKLQPPKSGILGTSDPKGPDATPESDRQTRGDVRKQLNQRVNADTQSCTHATCSVCCGAALRIDCSSQSTFEQCRAERGWGAAWRQANLDHSDVRGMGCRNRRRKDSRVGCTLQLYVAQHAQEESTLPQAVPNGIPRRFRRRHGVNPDVSVLASISRPHTFASRNTHKDSWTPRSFPSCSLSGLFKLQE